ncbi:hypothetical protein SeMB42_g07211 [Synchytrium endobioticum]|uniref:CCHC-type domain-containing protein n=1 Tax=Synchytrium endobioticum TaxID=286115 RepID=A0A507CCB4_9FUNG|nr:hypothetical protein SeMB42_g07211 [Synchytrium endobioticum]TPX49413.1 hypothetical protein SeLEV6574_g01500 [Synchytrium endobioticum]
MLGITASSCRDSGGEEYAVRVGVIARSNRISLVGIALNTTTKLSLVHNREAKEVKIVFYTWCANKDPITLHPISVDITFTVMPRSDGRRREQYETESSPSPPINGSTQQEQHHRDGGDDGDSQRHSARHIEKTNSNIAKSRFIVHPGPFTGSSDTRIVDRKLWLYRAASWSEGVAHEESRQSKSSSSKTQLERDRVQVVVELFEGSAHSWWYELATAEYEEASSNWKAFERAFIHKFLNAQVWGDAIDRVEDLRHGSNMTAIEFIEEFKQVVAPFNAVISLDEKIMRFVSKIQPLSLRQALRSWLGSDWWNRRDTTKRIVSMEDVYRWVKANHTNIAGTSMITPDSTPILSRNQSPVHSSGQHQVTYTTSPSASNASYGNSSANWKKRPSSVLEEDIINMVKKTRMRDDDDMVMMPEHRSMNQTEEQQRHVYPNANTGGIIMPSQMHSYVDTWPPMNGQSLTITINKNTMYDSQQQQPVISSLPPVMQPMFQSMLSPPPYIPASNNTAMGSLSLARPSLPPPIPQTATLTPTLRASQVMAPPGTTIDWSPALSVGSVASSTTSMGPPGAGSGSSMMTSSPMMISGSPSLMHMHPSYDPRNSHASYSTSSITSMNYREPYLSQPCVICQNLGHKASQCPTLDMPFFGAPPSFGAPGTHPIAGSGGNVVGMASPSMSNKTIEVQNLPPHMRVRKCYNCRKPGHKASECPEPLRNVAQQQPKRNHHHGQSQQQHLVAPLTPGPPGLV